MVIHRFYMDEHKNSKKYREYHQLNNHHINSKPSCNYYINFHHLKKDLYTLCDILHIQKKTLNHLNKREIDKKKTRQNVKDYISFYDDEAKSIVQELCKVDIEFFGYTFELGPTKNVSKVL